MAKTLVFRNRTTALLASEAGTLAELFVDTDKKTVVVMDGVTPGGTPLATESALTSSINAVVLVPVGGIIMWSGATTSVPVHWNLCDGSNGTPDLRNKFIVGAGSTYGTGATGGTSDAVVVSHSHTITDPGHTHNIMTNAGSGSAYPYGLTAGQSAPNLLTQSTSTNITINTAGQSGTNQNLPPYYALAYIMRIS